MTTLLIAEHEHSTLKDSTNKALTAATQLGAEVHVLVAGGGEGTKAAAEAAAKLAGVKKVLLAEGDAYAHDLAEPLAALIVALAPSYDAFVAPATSRFKNVMPRVAALLDVMQVSEIIKVVSSDTFERPIYAGNAIQTVKSKDAKKVITVRTSTFAAAGDGGSATVENAASAADPGLSSFVGEEVAKSDRPELTSAKIIVSGGRAMQSRENFAKYIEPLADKLGAGVGASRAAVDAGYAPNDWQVGQTGKVVAPELYIAIGISGAIQHLAGMKDSKFIVAIKKDGVIGSGQMGNGIAHVAALAGFDVVLNDVSVDRLKSGMATINGNLSRQVFKKIITEDARKQALDRIVSAETMDGLADCDLAIETATEKEEIKRKIFHDVCAVLKPEAIVASNTSSISITRLAASTDRPERFIGIHFMNPVPLMELVELIRGIATDDATFEASKEFVTRLGKHIAVSEDFPAFIVNRILLPMINEAIYTLYEGVGNVEAIDAAMKLGAHHPMGPLELADFIGLDTCLSIMQVLHEGLADSKYRPCPLLVKYVEAGWLGRKTQRGFYDYRGDKPVPTR